MSPNAAYLVSFCREENRVDRQTGCTDRQTGRQAAHTEEMLCEDTATRQLSASQGERPREKPSLLTP